MNLTRTIRLIPENITISNRVKYNFNYNVSLKSVRAKLLDISNTNPNNYTSILVGGSSMNSTKDIISSLPKSSRINVFSNGLYGQHLRDICKSNKVLKNTIRFDYKQIITPNIIEKSLERCNSTHVSLVHNELTSGIINPINDIIPIIKQFNKKVILDCSSSYGVIPIDINKLDIDYLIGSSNCLHGPSGLSFVIAKKNTLEECKNNTLYNNYEKQELNRINSLNTINSLNINTLNNSLDELLEKGGIHARYKKYLTYNQIIYNELHSLGFIPYLQRDINGPISSTFYIPKYIKNFDYNRFSKNLQKHNIIVGPSPIDDQILIRICNLGDINILELIVCVTQIKKEIIK
jgi:2-aminoethylphosphonate-pyruvate transaminase